MTGGYDINISNSKLCYSLRIRRNITVIRGEPATGKTTLVRLVELLSEEDPAIHFSSSRSVRLQILPSAYWELILDQSTGTDTIFVLDEFSRFMSSVAFAEKVASCGCYFILITRDTLSSIPCSIHEVYSLQTAHGITSLQEMFAPTLYGNMSAASSILTEDSNSGHDFFKAAFPDRSVETLGGKNNAFRHLALGDYRRALVIIDGAAFGFFIENLLKLILQYECCLVIPESFESVVLASDIFAKYHKDLADALCSVDSSLYFSWENFFTSYLIRTAQGTPLHYSKSHLNHAYISESNIRKILESYKIPYASLPKRTSQAQESSLFREI